MKIIGVSAVALSTAFAAPSALAQGSPRVARAAAPEAEAAPGDGAAAKGAAAPGDSAATTNHNVELVPVTHGAVGLYRHADLKALLMHVPKAAGLAAGNTRINALPLHRPGTETTILRNAVGVALRSHDVTSGAAHVGIRLPNIGTPVGKAGFVPYPLPVRANAGPAAHGTAYGTVMNRAAINGAAVGRRIASGPASIGGPAKINSGINGTLIRPKH